MALTDGLKAYYKLDSNANDSLGNYNGTASNVSWVAGKIGQAGSFNGSNSRIILPNSAKGGNSLTICLWVKFSSLSSNICLYSESGYAYISIDILTSGKLRFNNKTSATSLSNFESSSGLFSTGSWYHLIYSYNSSTGYLEGYINNTKVINQYRGGSQSYYTETNSNAIGAYVHSNGTSYAANMNGLIDEVGIWDRALSAGEVAELYNNGDGLTYPFTKSNQHLLRRRLLLK